MEQKKEKCVGMNDRLTDVPVDRQSSEHIGIPQGEDSFAHPIGNVHFLRHQQREIIPKEDNFSKQRWTKS